MKKYGLMLAIGLAAALPSQAVTNVFTGSVNNQWGTAGNWSLGHVADGTTEDILIQSKSVDLGGVSRAVGAPIVGPQRTIYTYGSTLSNGTIDFGGGGGYPPGAIVGENTTFASNFKFGNTIWRMFLTNCVYDSGNTIAWNMQYSTIAYFKGGLIRNTQAQTIGGAGGGGIVTFDGGNGIHFLGEVRMNIAASSFETGNLILTNRASVEMAGRGFFGTVDGTQNFGPGVYVNINDGTLRLDQKTLFGASAHLSSAGGRIHFLPGAPTPGLGIYNYMTNSSQHSGYMTVWMGMPDAVNFYDYEVAGTDLGANTYVNAFTGENFSIARLQLSHPSVASKMRLVDLANNDGLAGNEALYVDTLDLLNNATLDLNGLNLYVHDIDYHGFTLTTLNGNVIFAIPEPSTLTVVGLAAGLLVLRRKGTGRIPTARRSSFPNCLHLR